MRKRKEGSAMEEQSKSLPLNVIKLRSEAYVVALTYRLMGTCVELVMKSAERISDFCFGFHRERFTSLVNPAARAFEGDHDVLKTDACRARHLAWL